MACVGNLQQFRELVATPTTNAVVVILGCCIVAAPFFGVLLSAAEAVRARGKGLVSVRPIVIGVLQAVLCLLFVLPSVKIVNEEFIFPYLLVRGTLTLMPTLLVCWALIRVARFKTDSSEPRA